METQDARVVVGVDGSPGSRSALILALGEAARRGAELEIVVACPLVEPWTLGPPLLVPDVQAIVADARARGRALLGEVLTDPETPLVRAEVAGVRTGVVAIQRPPGTALVERSTTADLLVVGSRGHGAARSALGSVALHCVTHARCPVLVVHGDPMSAPAVGPVVVGLEDSTVSRLALRQAADEARRLETDLEVVTVYRPLNYWIDLYAVRAPYGPNPAQVEDRGRAILREVLGSAGGGRGARLVAEEGDPGTVLVQRASNARLLVVGSECRNRLEGLFLGSVALHCVIHAPCPVLVVHPQRGSVPGAGAPAPREPVTAR